MRAVWKFTLEMVAIQSVEMPKGAKILDVQFQDESLCLWAGVTPGKESEERTVQIVGTGHRELPDAGITYLATVQKNGYVWHVFEVER